MRVNINREKNEWARTNPIFIFPIFSYPTETAQMATNDPSNDPSFRESISRRVSRRKINKFKIKIR